MACCQVVFFHFLELRFLLTTNILSIETASVKAAAMRGIDGAGHISLQNYPVSFQGGVGDGRGGKESLGIRMERGLIDFYTMS
jgi:hypothetical protein